MLSETGEETVTDWIRDIRKMKTSAGWTARKKERDNMPENDELHISLRRNRNNLNVIGMGIIAFGIWTLIRTVMSAIFFTDSYPTAPADEVMSAGTFWIVFCATTALDLGIRLYVGLSAIAEGREGKRRRGYVALAVLMALFSAALLAVGLYAVRLTEDMGSLLVMMIVEMTSLIVLAEMIVSAVRVRRLVRKLAEKEG